MSSVSQLHTLEQQLLLACLPTSPDPERLALLLDKNPDWDELHRQGIRHHVLPLLYQTLKEYPDYLVPVSVLNRLRSWFAAQALRSMQMQKELRWLVDLLNGEKINVIPIKGPTLAEEAYGDIALRSFNDLDVLVPPEQAWDAVKVLLSHGFWIDFELPQERWAGLLKADNHICLHHSGNNFDVEVHWAVFFPAYVLPFDLSEHWSALKGGKEGRLDTEETLVMLCAHGARHLWEQLKWIVDIDRLLRNGPSVNWERALFVAECSGSVRILLLGLNLARVLCGTPLSDEMVAKIDGDRIVHSLTDDVAANLFLEDPGQRQIVREYTFYLKSRDNELDRLQLIFRGLFWPRLADWKAFPLGDRCHWLYYVLRPVRMFWKWIVKPIIPGTRKS